MAEARCEIEADRLGTSTDHGDPPSASSRRNVPGLLDVLASLAAIRDPPAKLPSATSNGGSAAHGLPADTAAVILFIGMARLTIDRFIDNKASIMKLDGQDGPGDGRGAGDRPGLRPGAGPRRGRRRDQRPRADRAGRGGRRRDPGDGPARGPGRGGRLPAGRRASRSSTRAIEALGRIDILVSNPAYSSAAPTSSITTRRRSPR